MIEILSVCAILIVFILAFRGFYILYINSEFIKDIIGLNFKRNISINFLFFFIIFVSFLFITFLNFNNGLLAITLSENLNVVILKIPKYLSISIFEELLFRVLIFSSLIHYVSNKIVLVFSTSILFSLYHFPNGELLFVSYFLGGVIYGYSFIKFQSITVSIGLHFFWNYIQGAMFGYVVSGNNSDGFLSLDLIPNILYNGGDYGPEGSIVGVFMRIVIILTIYFLPKQRKSKRFLRYSNSFN